MRVYRRLAGLLTLAAFASLLISGCGASSGAAPGASTSVVKVASATVGGTSKSVLTDTSGMSLYYFDPDTSTTAACSGSCAQTWPPVLLTSGNPASATALSGQLTTVNNANGRQVLYNGHPLYRYSADQKPGDTNGDGVAGKWHIVTPDVASIAAPAAPSSATDTPAPNPYNY